MTRALLLCLVLVAACARTAPPPPEPEVPSPPLYPGETLSLRQLIDENRDGRDDRIVARVPLPAGWSALGVQGYFEKGNDRVFVAAAKLAGQVATDARLFILAFDPSKTRQKTQSGGNAARLFEAMLAQEGVRLPGQGRVTRREQVATEGVRIPVSLMEQIEV